MAFFKKGPPGKRGIGFGGFNIKATEEPEQLTRNSEFVSKEKESKRPKPQSSDSSRKLPKLTDEEYRSYFQLNIKLKITDYASNIVS